MSFLQKMAEKKKGGVSIKDMLHKKLAGWEKSRNPKIVHASDVTKLEKEFCPRAFALYDITKEQPKDQFVGTSLRYTFEMGRAIQQQLNNKWLGGECVGNWECVRCKKFIKFGRQPKGGSCHDGKPHSWDYQEYRWKSAISDIDCGIDAMVIVGENMKLRVVEVKIMAVDMFKTLEAPLAEHRLRTNLYQRLIAESDDPNKEFVDTDQAHVLYISRGFGNKDTTLSEKGIVDAGFSPFKEFIVKRNDSETELYWRKGLEVKKFRETGIIPAGICPTAMVKRAKECSMCKACFSGKYPSGVTGA